MTHSRRCRLFFAVPFFYLLTGLAPSAAAAAPLSSHAGVDQRADIGQVVTLNGSASTLRTPDAQLHYSWTLTAPAGSGAILSDAQAPRPTFVIDLLGDYVATLQVSDGLQTATSTVRVSTGNVAPTARINAATVLELGVPTALDGLASSDANADSLRYDWRLLQAPRGSRAALDAPNSPTPYLMADVDGDYLVELRVKDRQSSSAPVTQWFSTGNAAPIADAGAARVIAPGQSVTLQAGATFDPNGDALEYQWRVVHAPTKDQHWLSDAATPTPLFYASAAGDYVLQLSVRDGSALPAALATTVVSVIERTTLVSGAQTRGGLDTDGDGIPDATDNCVNNFNPSQLDTNGDGFGNRCDADLDNDGFITNFGDLGLLRLAFFSSPGAPNWNPDADFNEDNVINFSDLGIMRTFFFGPPGPLALTFINPNGGSWHDPANWSPPVIPNTTHTVRIDLDPAAVVEYSTGTSEIAGLVATSPVAITGGALSIDGNAQFNAGLTINSATLATANVLPPTDPASAQIVVTGSVTIDNVDLGMDMLISNAATVNVNEGMTLDNATITLSSNGSFSLLNFNGASGTTSTLDGTGELAFAGTTTVSTLNDVRVFGGHNLVIGENITVRTDTTGGRIRSLSNTGTITFDGNVISDVADRTIGIGGAPLIFGGVATITNNATFAFDPTAGDSRITTEALIDAVNGNIDLFGIFEHEGLTTLENGTLDIGNLNTEAWSNTGSIDVINGMIELGGLFSAAAAGSITGSGEMLINGVLENDGVALDIATLFPGTITFGGNGTLLGGSLITSPMMIESAFTVDGVTLGADATIANAATLTVRNDLILDNATLALTSNGSFSILSFVGDADATSLLGGTGTVRFDGTTTASTLNDVRVATFEHNLQIGAGITVETGTTGGRIRGLNSNNTITFDGNVISNIDGRDVWLAGAPLIISGNLDASNGGRIRADFQTTGSLITPTAVLTATTGGELELFGPFTQQGTINVTDSTLDIGDNNTESWSNVGTININNATVELGGLFTVAAAGTFTGSGTLLLNGTLDNVGGMVDFGSLFSGSLTLGGSGTVLGGSIVTSPFTVSSNFTFDGVTLGADMTIANATNLTIVNGLTLDNAAISIESAGSFTVMTFDGTNGTTSAFDGTGEVRFAGTTTSSSVSEVRVQTVGHSLAIGPGITLISDTTGGRVRNISSNSGITFDGSIDSNIDGRTITIQAAPLNINGSLEATNGAKIIADFVTAGVIDAGASISATGADSEIELVGFLTNNAAITITDGILDIGNNNTETWTNNGSITLTNGSAQFGGQFATADIGTIAGTGTILVDGLLDNTGQNLDASTIFAGALTFGGNGTLLGGSIVTTPVEVDSAFTLDGVTLATDMTINNAATLTARNDLTLNNGNILINSAGSFTTLTFTGDSGATSTFGGTGEVRFTGSTTSSAVSEVRNSGGNHALVVDSGITVRTTTTGGRIRTTGSLATMEFNGTVVADVAGRTVTMQSPNAITVGGTILPSNGATVTLDVGPGSSITGAATITANGGDMEVFGPFATAGTIDITDGTLEIGNNNTEAWSNTGSITLTNGTIELGGLIVIADIGTVGGTGTMLIDGDVQNTGQSLDLGTIFGGAITLGNNGALVGGSLTTTPVTVVSNFDFEDGVTLATDMTIANNGRVNLFGGLTLNNADISLESAGSFTYLNFTGTSGEAVTFGGTGEVRFAGTTTGSSVNEIRVANNVSLTIGSGVTLRTDTTGGRVRTVSGSGGVTIAGDVISDVAGRSVTLSSPALLIEGTIDTAAGATTVLGNVTLASTAVLGAQIGGATGNLLGVYTSTNATLAGTLNVTLANGFAPVLGQSYPLFTYSSNTGTFDTINVPALGGGLSLTESYNAGDLTFTVTN